MHNITVRRLTSEYACTHVQHNNIIIIRRRSQDLMHGAMRLQITSYIRERRWYSQIGYTEYNIRRIKDFTHRARNVFHDFILL